MVPSPSLSVALDGFIQNKARRSAVIATELRRLITCGQLKPGDQLPTESILCQQFGVSRTTLREAIQMLRTTGLLDVTPGRGSFVKVPNMRHLANELAMVGVYTPQSNGEASQLLLILLKDTLSRMGKTQPQQRKDLYQYILNRLSSADENAQLEADWFLALTALGENALSTVFVETLLALNAPQRAQRYRNPDDVLRTVHIQMRTNAALVDGDFALAERVMSQYLVPAQPPAVAA